eukprot:m.70983 g.70983  ORF g.70983 m.70983 type:complete len:389 (+) comp14335_c0_seq1:89-1255(+)
MLMDVVAVAGAAAADEASSGVLSLLMGLALAVLFAALLTTVGRRRKNNNKDKEMEKDVKPSLCRSVNYHFTRNCNYECGFCFHTSKTKDTLHIDQIKQGLRKLKDAGMEKINFSGGEPFLHAPLLGQMVDFCKQELNLNVHIVSNGSLIREQWMEEHAANLDYLSISCDSFDPVTNETIGRRARKSSGDNQADIARRVAGWCNMYDVVFKINTVVNSYNKDEDMSSLITELQPQRWKLFQTLLLKGENMGGDDLRDARRFSTTSEEFDAFVQRHKHLNPVPENNEDMRDSYLILDEQMRFLDCRNNEKKPSRSILDVPVEEALKDSGFDVEAFVRRGGVYTYSKAELAAATAAAAAAAALAAGSGSSSSCCGSSDETPDIEDLQVRRR